MIRSDTIGELAKALAAFHATVTNPRADKVAEVHSKSGTNFSYNYVDFAQLLDTDRVLLAAQGLSVVQEIIATQNGVGATTLIMHESGEWLQLEPLLIPAGDSAQDYGAAASYARRYSYMAALDLAGADDGATPPAGKAKSAGPGKSSDAQQKKIHVEAKQAGVSDADLAKVLAKRYQADGTKALSKEQASDLIERLIAEKERREAAAAAGADPETGEVEEGPGYWPEGEEAPGMSAEEAKAKFAANRKPKDSETLL